MQGRSARALVRTCALGCAVVSILLAGSIARAQRTSSLSWVRLAGTEACISTQALAEGVERRLGRRVFVSASQADLSLEGHVERATRPSELIATLVVSDRAGRVLGRRVLRVAGDKCEALEASLVLVIAIAIDPGATLSAVLGPAQDLSPEAETMLAQLGLPELSEQQIRDQLAVPDPNAIKPAASAPAPPPAQTHTPARSQRLPEAKRAPALRIRVGIGVSGELGVLPDRALGAVLGLTLESAWFWQTDFWITGLLPQSEHAGQAGGVGHFSFWAAGVGICPPLMPKRRVELRLCGGARGGVLLARGSGFAERLSRTGPWLEATLYGGVRVRIVGPWSLHANLGLGIPIVRDTFSYADDLGQVRPLHRADSLTARIEIGAGVSF